MFSAEWLALREPADASARSMRVARALESALPTDRVLQIVDLGAGTGANARFLAEHLPGPQNWLLVDNDAELLGVLPEAMRSWHMSVERQFTARQLDLRTAVDDAALYDGRELVTASALLDLVSEQWLQTLAARCAQNGACVLFALTYDGRIACTPAEPEDDEVRELVNRHQRTDKGFGAALGPDAAAAAQASFASAGYTIQCDASDWVLDGRFTELQRRLIDGWAHAAVEVARDRSAAIESWRTRRLGHVDARRSHIVVGHTDLVGWPTHGSRA